MIYPDMNCFVGFDDLSCFIQDRSSGRVIGMVIDVEIHLTSMSWTPCIFLLPLLLLVCPQLCHHQPHLLPNGIIVLDIYVDLVCPPLFIKDVWGMFLLSLLFTAKVAS